MIIPAFQDGGRRSWTEGFREDVPDDAVAMPPDPMKFQLSRCRCLVQLQWEGWNNRPVDR